MAKQWRKTNKEKAKLRTAEVAEKMKEKGLADPKIAKKAAKKARKEKNRATRDMAKAIEMFSTATANYNKETAEKVEKEREKAREAKQKAINAFSKAQESAAVAESMAGKVISQPLNAEKELLKRLYQ
ncbi:uncharacterized protein LOC128390184 [Panonychus citri]|uniref:uncharacterized protein LOC128390184 n=1 Tax=Panonychus citri TaxID=50023 RepID=UPI0023075DB6|nr:uncharacterized protein LOC128390184 [Panonychus citri]